MEWRAPFLNCQLRASIASSDEAWITTLWYYRSEFTVAALVFPPRGLGQAATEEDVERRVQPQQARHRCRARPWLSVIACWEICGGRRMPNWLCLRNYR
jgi:hypothetical protein